eukprot:12680456-Prorocentrum_lima.AAC.1
MEAAHCLLRPLGGATSATTTTAATCSACSSSSTWQVSLALQLAGPAVVSPYGRHSVAGAAP